MPWLWNTQMTRVLMIGLGGGSTQRSYARYCPETLVETVELDPVVVRAARDFFHFVDSPRQKVYVSDGRVFLRRSQARYDAILVDAYVSSRYGSCIPHHLATREFFALAHDHLTTNGVLAYNVIGSLRGWQDDLIGSLYQTLKVVFPEVYLFPAKDSENVVLLATKAPNKTDLEALRGRTTSLVQSKRVSLPSFASRVLSFRGDPPPNLQQSPVLTDDFAPIDNLLRSRGP
jgi:spermidine synthase